MVSAQLNIVGNKVLYLLLHNRVTARIYGKNILVRQMWSGIVKHLCPFRKCAQNINFSNACSHFL